MTSPTIAGVCSGIGGIELGFERAGFAVAWSCEKDAQARAVLEHRFPETLHFTDLTNDELLSAPEPTVLAGGTPCQGFSIAGLRRGLADERSNLCLRFCELAAGFPGSFVVWENVPGVLTQEDNAFGAFLAGLVGADAALLPSHGSPEHGAERPEHKHYWRRRRDGTWTPRWPRAGVVSGPLRTAAWRVLDSQYFGVAQRRARVLVVADPGDGSAPEILFEWEGLRRDTPPRRGAREKVTGTLSARTEGGGGLGTDFEVDGGLVPHEVAGTLCNNGKASGSATQQDAEQGLLVPMAFGGNNCSGPVELSPSLTANRGCHNPGDFEAGTLIATHPPELALTLTAQPHLAHDDTRDTLVVLAFSGRARGDDGRGYDRAPQVTGPITGALETVKPWNVAHPLPFDDTQITSALNRSQPKPGDPSHPLSAQARPPAIAFPERMGSTAHASAEELSPCLGATNPTAVAFQERGRGNGTTSLDSQEELAYALTAPTGGTRRQEKNVAIAANGTPNTEHEQTPSYVVRRLTPRECDRLQAFPDDWGQVDYKGKPMSDAARYKQLGNAVTVTVFEWLARRIFRHLISSFS